MLSNIFIWYLHLCKSVERVFSLLKTSESKKLYKHSLIFILFTQILSLTKTKSVLSVLSVGDKTNNVRDKKT